MESHSRSGWPCWEGPSETVAPDARIHYAEFFDPYGYPPERLAEEFETFLTRNVENWSITQNKKCRVILARCAGSFVSSSSITDVADTTCNE